MMHIFYFFGKIQIESIYYQNFSKLNGEQLLHKTANLLRYQVYSSPKKYFKKIK